MLHNVKYRGLVPHRGQTFPGEHEALVSHYAGQTIVEVVSRSESAKIPRLDPEEINNSDKMKLFVFGTEGKGQVNLVALLDNLGKGASGAAVQNLKLMLDL